MRTLALIALLAGSLFGQQADWRFAHPDATLVGGFRPVALLNSPILASALAQQQKDPQVGMILAMARGVMGGVTEVRFSMQDNGTKEPDVVALIVGRFDEATMAALGQTQAKWKRLDANTLLMGNGASLDRAFARAQSNSASFQSRALEGVESLSKYDLWVAGKLPNSLPLATTGMVGAGAGSLDISKLGLKSLAFGMSMQDSVEMEFTAQTASPAMADALIKGAHDAEKAQAPQLRGTLQSFAEGATAHFRVSVPKDVVIQAMQQRANAGTGVLGLPQAAPVQTAPKRKTIIIDGLDSGPKEIAVQK